MGSNAILFSAILGLFGIFSGLAVRIVMEGLRTKRHFISIFLLSLKLNILYPIAFPLFVLGNKEAFAEVISEEILKEKQIYGKANKIKARNSIKRAILKDLTFFTVLKVWFGFLEGVNVCYNDFVSDNIDLANEFILDRFNSDAIEECSKEKEQPEAIFKSNNQEPVVEMYTKKYRNRLAHYA